MSTSDRVINVGASARASDVQKVADVAAMADDRALEILFTPGSVQKRIVPLSEDSVTGGPGTLVTGKDTDGTLANAQVGVRPGDFIAGVSGDANSIGLSCKLDAKVSSPTIANNSSGSTRYDLLYASIAYSVATTQSVRQKPTSGSAPVTANLTTQLDMAVTLGVVAGVSSSNPTASLPADTGSGKAAVYNFPLAMIAVPNGFSGGAINQATITQLWGRGYVKTPRVRGQRLLSLYYGATAEKPSGSLTAQTQGAERFGGDNRFFGHFKVVSATPTFTALNNGDILDNTIDWRYRMIRATISYLGSASNLPLETSSIVLAPASTAEQTLTMFSGPGSNPSGPSAMLLGYNSGNGVYVGVFSDGTLRVWKSSSGVPVDATNGDLITMMIEATDQFLVGG